MNRRETSTIVVLLLALVSGQRWCAAQDSDRARVESEAIGQAAEADRLFEKGEFASALRLYEAERASRAALGDRRYEAYAARAAGCCHARLGDFDAAIDAWHAARAIDAKRDDRGFEGYDWYLIGDVELRRARPAEALQALERAIPFLSTAADRDHEADARRLLAVALVDLNRTGEAGPHLERALALARALDDPRRSADVLAQLGRVALSLGDAGAAAEWLSDARDAFHDQQRTDDSAEMDRLLGDAMLGLGRPDVASARVDDAVMAHERLDDRASLADDYMFLAALKAAGNDLRSARSLAGKAAGAIAGADDAETEIEALVSLARYEGLDGDWGKAGLTLARALKIAGREAEPVDHARLLILAADVEIRAKHRDLARRLVDEADAIAKTLENPALTRSIVELRSRTR